MKVVLVLPSLRKIFSIQFVLKKENLNDVV